LNEPKLQKELDDARSLVDVDHFDITTRELVRMAAEDEIRRAPVYQRKFRWDEQTESRLVESVLLGLPIPSFFMATNPDGTWEVVDGLQRLSTLMHFMAEPGDSTLDEIHKDSPLRLSGLESLVSFNDLTYEDLPTPIQLAMGKRGLRVTALSDKSNLEARFEVFERLNTGGVALSPQEVRACIFQGGFNDMLRDLAELEPFKKLVKLQRMHQHDATREELVLKFFAYMYDSDNFDGAVGDFLTKYMEKASRKFDMATNIALFTRSATALYEIIQGPFLRKGYSSTPLNQFESAMVATGNIIRSGKDVGNPNSGWLNDKEWLTSSTKGTNTRAMLRNRINRATVLLAA
jgi:hypothetical protein